MKQKLNIDSWNRKDHFHFFNQFEEPFFGICTTIDCTIAYDKAKEMQESFFLYYLFHSIHAANLIEPFKYRIDNEEVIIHSFINASATINRPNGTFGFSNIVYNASFDTFKINAKKEIERVQCSEGLEAMNTSENVIHYSSIPWINFTALSHARSFSFKDSIPKISFGKMTEINAKKTMPMSVHVHHALMDGFHVGEYINLFQELMNQ